MSETLNTREFAALVRSKRGALGLRAAAKEIGISPATLQRVEQEKVPDLDTFARICSWLGVPPSRFLGEKNARENEPAIPKDMETPDIIAAYLRADRALSKPTAEALAEMIRLAYQVAKKQDQ